MIFIRLVFDNTDADSAAEGLILVFMGMVVLGFLPHLPTIAQDIESHPVRNDFLHHNQCCNHDRLLGWN
jgi:hypothetical protein